MRGRCEYLNWMKGALKELSLFDLRLAPVRETLVATGKVQVTEGLWQGWRAQNLQRWLTVVAAAAAFVEKRRRMFRKRINYTTERGFIFYASRRGELYIRFVCVIYN